MFRWTLLCHTCQTANKVLMLSRCLLPLWYRIMTNPKHPQEFQSTRTHQKDLPNGCKCFWFTWEQEIPCLHCLPTTWAVIIFNQRCFDSSLKGRWNAQNSRNCCFDIINHLESIWFRSIETNLPIYHESNLFYCLYDNAQITNFSLIRDIQNRN